MINWCKGKSFSHHDKIWKKILNTGLVKSVVEVGTFVGYTACLIASHPNVDYVFTIDTWNFSLNRCANPEKQFFLNISSHLKNKKHKIIPIKGVSWEVGEAFKKLGIKVDLVYIDANHKKESVRKDLNAWYFVGKYICGDDYTHVGHSAVIEEVDKFAKRHNCLVKNIGKFWWYEYL